MKKDIHPKYYKTKISCACGNTFETGSTKPEIRVEICSACHPFFTGKQKFIDTAGRIEKFQKKYETVRKREEKHQKQRDLLVKAAEDAAFKEAASKAGVDEGELSLKASAIESSRLATLGELKAVSVAPSIVEDDEPAEAPEAVEEVVPAPEAPAPADQEPAPVAEEVREQEIEPENR